MNACDLRYGNWLKGHLTGRYLQVDWLVMKHMEDGNIQSVYNPEIPVYEPIPLTPEILEKAGFVRQNNGWSIGRKSEYDDSCFGLFDYNYCSGDLNLKLNGSFLPMPEVKFVHTLQNLYFALTGTELETNL